MKILITNHINNFFFFFFFFTFVSNKLIFILYVAIFIFSNVQTLYIN